MVQGVLFPFADFWWFYLGFVFFVVTLLALDLGVFHKNIHEVSLKEAAKWTVVWASLALLFNAAFYLYSKYYFSTDPRFVGLSGFDPQANAKRVALEFLTGFLVEKSLAVDNLFVFVVIFASFRVPKKYHHRILFLGIIGALVFRACFVVLGSWLLQYEWVMVFFGLLLILTGLKIGFASSSQAERVEEFQNNWITRVLSRMFRVHPTITDHRLFIRINEALYATPLFLTLISLEFSDIIFAIDSVPAIFALTREPLVVFTSNMFAILGLRSIYFLVAGVLDRFIYIKYGLAAVLLFIGAKMVFLNRLYDGQFPISWSLGVIGVCMGGAMFASWLVVRRSRA